jgi:hypothetical protein
MIKSKKVVAAVIISIFISMCFAQIENDTNRLESNNKSGQETELKKTAVNMDVFQLPKNIQDMFKLTSTSLEKNEDDYFIVPTECVQEFGGKSVVFIELGNDEFAVREVNVKMTVEENSLVMDNLTTGEMVVVNGASLIRDGLVRQLENKQKGSNKGHSHGKGGHSH